jgi:hypothetical protein
MHKSATKCNETLSKWCKNKHGASKIIDMFWMYQNIASKLSFHDLAFIAAALRRDRTYHLSALIAFHLDANCEKGEICGGIIASRLLALHGVVPHILDLQFPVEKLDLNSMIHHKFVSPHACMNNLTFEITFFKKST